MGITILVWIILHCPMTIYILLARRKTALEFLGYTTQHTKLPVRSGVSSISDAGIAFAQNEKTLHDYYAAIENNTIPVTRGFFLK